MGDPGVPIEESPDEGWVTGLTGAPAPEVRKVLAEAEADREFWDEVMRAHRGGGRESYAQIRAPFELYAMARLLRPRHVVEVGVSSGVSSSAFLRAIQRNGTGVLHSIDLPTPQKGARFDAGTDSPVALPPGHRSGWAVPPSVRAGWDLRIGSSRDLLPPLVGELPEIGIFLHDSLHTFEHATFEFTTVAPKVPVGGVVVADNCNWLDHALEAFAPRLGGPVRFRRGFDLGAVRRLSSAP